MNDIEKIKRITELSKELKLLELNKQKFENEFSEQSINDLKEKMWQLYCFASDVIYTINLEDKENEVE